MRHTDLKLERLQKLARNSWKLTDQLNPWSQFFLSKMIVVRRVQNLPTFDWTVSSLSQLQDLAVQPALCQSTCSCIILSYLHKCLKQCFAFRFNTKLMYPFFISSSDLHSLFVYFNLISPLTTINKFSTFIDNMDKMKYVITKSGMLIIKMTVKSL
jgi:hypothetical protein